MEASVETRDSSVARLTAALIAMTLLACSGDRQRQLPTEPSSPTPPAASAVWPGTWTFERAAPAGDCLADGLNDWSARGGMAAWDLDLTVERDATSSFRLRFLIAYGAEKGFWPVEFVGTLDDDGVLRASVPPALIGNVRQDPWMDLCYWQWTVQGGDLSATVSPDGRSLSGTTVETFRVIDPGSEDKTFTVHSRFFASGR